MLNKWLNISELLERIYVFSAVVCNLFPFIYFCNLNERDWETKQMFIIAGFKYEPGTEYGCCCHTVA